MPSRRCLRRSALLVVPAGTPPVEGIAAAETAAGDSPAVGKAAAENPAAGTAVGGSLAEDSLQSSNKGKTPLAIARSTSSHAVRKRTTSLTASRASRLYRSLPCGG